MTFRLHVREDSHLFCSVCIVILDVRINHDREGQRGVYTVNIKGKIFSDLQFTLNLDFCLWMLQDGSDWVIWHHSRIIRWLDWIFWTTTAHTIQCAASYLFVVMPFCSFIFSPKITVIAQHEWKHVSRWGLCKIHFHDCICCCKIYTRANTHSHSRCGVA